MNMVQRLCLFQLFAIVIIVLISPFENDTNALRTVPKQIDLPHKAIQTRPGKKEPTTLPNMCPSSCMQACAKDQSCMAYMFDGNDNSCKMWSHLEIEVVSQFRARSGIRGIIAFITFQQII